MKDEDKIDPGYCGPGSLNTGSQDPFFIGGACPAHDADFQQILNQIAAHQQNIDDHQASIDTLTKLLPTPLHTFRNFIGNLLTVAKENPSFWTIAGLPAYILIGGFGGILRQQQLLNRLSKPKSDDLD